MDPQKTSFGKRSSDVSVPEKKTKLITFCAVSTKKGLCDSPEPVHFPVRLIKIKLKFTNSRSSLNDTDKRTALFTAALTKLSLNSYTDCM